MNKAIHAAKAVAVVLLAIALGACATKLGRDFDTAYARQIKPGETTKADVRNNLGRPALVSRGVAGQDEWIYAYYEGGGLGVTMRTWFGQSDEYNQWGQQQKRLVVTFNGDRVEQARFTQELPTPAQLEEAYR